MNVFEAIKAETAGLGGRTAVIEGGREVSYEALIKSSEALAAALQCMGVEPYHRVCLVCENGIDYITVSLALLCISAVVAPVSVEHTEDEIQEALKRIDAEFLIFRGASFSSEGAKEIESDSLSGDMYLLKSEPAGVPPKGYIGLNPAFIRFSSGTTGKSKGVVLSHESIIERTDEADRGLRITKEDRVLWVLSMSFHFVVSILLFLRRGAAIIVCTNPVEESLSEGIYRQGGTFMYAAPFHYALMCRSPLFATGPLGAVRLAVSTTVKLPSSIAEDFAGKFGMKLAEAYGIIEVGLPFINLSGDLDKRSTVGKALPGYEMRIDKPDAEGVGEILIKGAGMFDAYYSPWRLREEVLDEGWFRTGDVGLIDEEGYLTIAGRNKEVINFAGMKIFPQEVESVINRYPGVRESIVYGEDHAVYGQLPMAQVVASGGLLDINGLRGYCYRSLAQYKVPKGFEVVEAIRRTRSGKIVRG